VIHETQNALRVVTKLDVIKCRSHSILSLHELTISSVVLPKQNSIFTFGVPLHSILTDPPNTKEPVTPDVSSSKYTVLDAPHLLFTLYGNQLRFRAAERAGKKFKAKMTIEL
jgi:ribonuclease P protein subunit POP4